MVAQIQPVDGSSFADRPEKDQPIGIAWDTLTENRLACLCTSRPEFLNVYGLQIACNLKKLSGSENSARSLGSFAFKLATLGAFYYSTLSRLLTTCPVRSFLLRLGSGLYVGLPTSEVSWLALGWILRNEFPPLPSPAMYLLLEVNTYDGSLSMSPRESLTARTLFLECLEEALRPRREAKDGTAEDREHAGS